MDESDDRPVGANGDPVAPGAAPAWSVPSPWVVQEPPVTAAPAPPPPPAPVRQIPAGWKKALVLAVALTTITAAWAAVDRLDLHGSRPTFSSAPKTTAEPGRSGRFSPRPARPSAPVTVPDIDVNAVAAKVEPGVVDIYTQLDSGNMGAGTGVIVTPDGEVLTNNHVIDGAVSISVTMVQTGQRYAAVVVGTDPSEDIAVLQLQNAAGLPTVPLGDSSKVKVGDPVVALGNAGGVGGRPHTVSGNVVALAQSITATDQDGSKPETLSGLIQIDAPLQPGDSGGPLVNRSGQVIGIDTAASATRRFRSVGDSVGFAIPIAKVQAIAAQIESGQASATVHIGVPARLGVVMNDQSASGTSGGGVVVTQVQAGSPAGNAGLVAGDIITEVDGQPAVTPEGVSTLIKNHRAGDKINFSWTDVSNRRRTATVILAAGPAD